MAKELKNSQIMKNLKNIIAIDGYTGYSSILKDNTLKSIQKPTSKKSNIIVTYVANKDLIIAPINISDGIEDEDLDGAIENKAYEELGLDPAVEYMIKELEIVNTNDDGRLFQLFIIEQNKYDEIFDELAKKTKYIDLIVPSPLLFQSLYNFEIVDNRGIHCYLYFSKNDTFLSFYRDGEYFYSKSIKYSFEEIYNRYCEMSGDTLDEVAFFNILKKEGMRATSSEFQQNIMKLFGEIFISINDIIIYTKRAYNIDVIDDIYIGSPFGSIPGLDDYVQNYLGLRSSPLDFDLHFDIEDWHADQLQRLMLATGLDFLNDSNVLNMTLYPSPPPFFKRTSGQFVLTTIGVTALGLSVPLYYYAGSKINQFRNSKLSDEKQALQKEVNKYKAIISNKIKEIKKIDKIIDKRKKAFDAKEETLKQLYDKKVNYRLKSDQLELFASDFAKFGVKMYNISNKNNNFYIDVVADDSKKITKLINYISKKYKDQLNFIDIDVIEKDQNSTLYQGLLKVGFNG